MAAPLHHVIIGSGSAGFGAAKTLRARDAGCRITMITLDSLPFYNRFDLPQVFRFAAVTTGAIYLPCPLRTMTSWIFRCAA